MSGISGQFALFGAAVVQAFGFPQIFVTLIATVAGIIVGAIPGLTATMALALLINLTYTMQLPVAVAFLLGVYVGAVMGGCYSAIMINIPGTPSAAATALDGFILAKQGHGGQAIGTGVIASFIGTLISIAILIFLTPFLYKIALRFGKWEYFLISVFGIMICGNLSTQSTPLKGWIVGFLGFFTAMIGLDAIYAYPRFTYGSYNMMGGISLIPALIGVFGISEVLDVLQEDVPYSIESQLGRVLPNKEIWKDIFKTSIRSGLIGCGIGIVPGAGEDIAAWVSYDVGKRRSKSGHLFGKGSYEGLASAETANNACIGGAMIPLLTLAIPGSPPAAMFLAAIWLHGIKPGPMLAIENPSFLYLTAVTLIIATFAMLIFGLALVKPIVQILKINRKILMPIIVPLTVIGAYAGNVSIFDIRVMFVFGIIGYILRKMNYPMAPLVLGIILGPSADISFRQALMQGQGSIIPLLGRPVGIVLMVSIVWIFVSGIRSGKQRAKMALEEEERLKGEMKQS
jgi:putative tricarboxylic transport membrane protein